MTTHAMIDLETLGTAPDCAVLTIGAIKFDPNIAKPAWDEFYYRFDVDDYVFATMTLYLDIINLFLYLLELLDRK